MIRHTPASPNLTRSAIHRRRELHDPPYTGVTQCVHDPPYTGVYQQHDPPYTGVAQLLHNPPYTGAATSQDPTYSSHMPHPTPAPPSTYYPQGYLIGYLIGSSIGAQRHAQVGSLATRLLPLAITQPPKKGPRTVQRPHKRCLAHNCWVSVPAPIWYEDARPCTLLTHESKDPRNVARRWKGPIELPLSN